jgi:hypothetical protein
VVSTDTHSGSSEVRGHKRVRKAHMMLKDGAIDEAEYTLVMADGSTVPISVVPTLKGSSAGDYYEFTFRGDIAPPSD